MAMECDEVGEMGNDGQMRAGEGSLSMSGAEPHDLQAADEAYARLLASMMQEPLPSGTVSIPLISASEHPLG